MSNPRPVLPNRTYLITRRCSQRAFFLRPSKLINQVFLYCLARAADLYNIDIHAFCVMSNHYHIVVTDPDAVLPEFMRWLNEFVAKCINTALGRWESLWEPPPYSAVHLVDADDVFDKMLYTFNNPVEAKLVSSGHLWPGLRSTPQDLDNTPFVVSRPKIFFRDSGELPEQLSLQLVTPRQFKQLQINEFRTRLNLRIRETESQIREHMQRTGKHFLGAKGVLALSPHDSPKSSTSHRKLDPKVACKDLLHRIEALRCLSSFLVTYRRAWRRFCAGEPDTTFPLGTYLMSKRYNVLRATEP